MNPCVGVEPVRDNGARERYLTVAEVQRLFEELDGNRNVQVGQVIRLLLYTGARKREVLDARWEHLDLERRTLTVPVSKSGRPRHIPLSDAALELLRGLPRDPAIPWVFFNPRTGKPPVSVFYAWDTIRKRVGLGEVRMHDLRHTFASFLVSSGRSLYEVQALLGHHDPKVTMRYAHLSPHALVEAANVVGRAVLPGGKSDGEVAPGAGS
jgi:integrase